MAELNACALGRPALAEGTAAQVGIACRSLARIAVALPGRNRHMIAMAAADSDAEGWIAKRQSRVAAEVAARTGFRRRVRAVLCRRAMDRGRDEGGP